MDIYLQLSNLLVEMVVESEPYMEHHWPFLRPETRPLIGLFWNNAFWSVKSIEVAKNRSGVTKSNPMEVVIYKRSSPSPFLPWLLLPCPFVASHASLHATRLHCHAPLPRPRSPLLESSAFVSSPVLSPVIPLLPRGLLLALDPWPPAGVGCQRQCERLPSIFFEEYNQIMKQDFSSPHKLSYSFFKDKKR